MKRLYLMVFFIVCTSLKSVQLDFSKIYPIINDRCSECGNESPSVYVLDLSNQDLDDIDDIHCLLVRWKNNVTMLKKVENLYLKLNNNNLKKLHRSLLKLDLIKLNLKGNKSLIIPDWLESSEKKWYIKKD